MKNRNRFLNEHQFKKKLICIYVEKKEEKIQSNASFISHFRRHRNVILNIDILDSKTATLSTRRKFSAVINFPLRLSIIARHDVIDGQIELYFKVYSWPRINQRHNRTLNYFRLG